MTLAPWEYLFLSFNSHNFPDLFHPTWIASLVLLVVLVVLYNRADPGAPPPRSRTSTCGSGCWWTGLITFSLCSIESLFVFDFFLVLADRDHRPRRRWSGSGSSASRRSSRRTSSASRGSATSPSRSSPTRRRRSGDAAGRAASADARRR